MGGEIVYLCLCCQQLSYGSLGPAGFIAVDQISFGRPVHSGHVLDGRYLQCFSVFLLRQSLNFFRQGFQSRFLGSIAQRAGNRLAVILES